MKRARLIKVAIVEADDKFRKRLGRWIGRTGALRCSCSCATGGEALKLIPSADAQVVLLDIDLPDLSGVECVRRLKASKPALQILILMADEDRELIFSGLQAGAIGYLVKGSSPAQILEAILLVRDGGAPMSSRVARKLVLYIQRPIMDPDPPTHLTRREEEVLGCVARGLSNKEISELLSIAVETVRVHLKKIYEKLHVRCRTQAALKALSLNRAESKMSLKLSTNVRDACQHGDGSP